MFESLKDRIQSLPEPERSARRAFYSNEEWYTSWELNAWPHQLPPVSDQWTSWTIIGSRRTGKTEAGYQWSKEQFLSGNNVLGVFQHKGVLEDVTYRLWGELRALPAVENSTDFSLKGMETSAPRLKLNGKIFSFVTVNGYNRFSRGLSPDCIWADEVLDANIIVRDFADGKRRLLFTQPVKLDPDTMVSRAGDGRIY